jgi:hypothetical protein
LFGLGRLARGLLPMSKAPAALLLVDEVGALSNSARHSRGLVGRAREAGLAVVLATLGPSDLEAVDRALLPQVLQDTAWQLAFRQGSPHDARQVEALFGQAWIQDLMRWTDGRSSSRHVERPRVSVDEWMNALEPGDAWLRVAPIDIGWRQHRVRVALPTRKMRTETQSENASETKGPEIARRLSRRQRSRAFGALDASAAQHGRLRRRAQRAARTTACMPAGAAQADGR